MAELRAPRDIRGLLERLSLTHIRQRGDELWASCPNHHDSGDSWSINVSTGVHSCFACGYRGHVQGLVMDVLSCDNFVANRLIRSFGAAELLDTTRFFEQLADPEPPAEVYRRPPLSAGAKFASFRDVPPEQLLRRRVTPEAAKHFDLRWNHTTAAWVLPIRSPGNRLMGWQEKSPDGVRNRPVGVDKSKTVFGAEHLRSCDRVIVVESPLDAALLFGLGYEYVAATFGAGVSEDQMRLLMEYADSVLLALDHDEAGRENTARLATGLQFNLKGRKVRGTNWAARVPLWVAAYGQGDPKDVGEMTEHRIHELLANPESAITWATSVERLNNVQGRASSFPSRGVRKNGQARRYSGGVRYGAR